jgi:glycine/D-amino acid oxidase-like deaminating enzyme
VYDVAVIGAGIAGMATARGCKLPVCAESGRLAQRLEPTLTAAGVVPRWVP